MLFNSYHFLIFLPIAVIVHFILPDKVRNVWLLICSYYFYMSWKPEYAFLLMFVTIVTYASGLSICRYPCCDKQILVISIITMLGVLAYFKYTNLILSMVNKVITGVGHGTTLDFPDIILPVGISFFTFQAIGYVVDVYRGNCSAERNLVNYALFLSFFPQLVAGPIEKASSMLNQIKSEKFFEFDRFRSGVWTILWGYFLKIVVADRAAIFVDVVYADYIMYGGYYLIVATILFGIQIYGDFCGYSIIAKGCAEILGIELSTNFKAPYLSEGIGEFWRRWHMSLMRWFKDYVYIPLGGSKKGTLRKYLNEMIVFLVSGLWHGANLKFAVWGGYNGTFQIAEQMLQKRFNLPQKSRYGSLRLIRTCLTFVIVDFGWIFFRADSISDAVKICGNIILADNPWILFDGSLYECGLNAANFSLLIVAIMIILAIDYLGGVRNIDIKGKIMNQPAAIRCIFFAATVTCVVVFGIWGVSYDAESFIYFQF